jgi:hypothetical protein
MFMNSLLAERRFRSRPDLPVTTITSSTDARKFPAREVPIACQP